MNNDWMIGKKLPKRTPDEIFSDLDEKMEKALEAAKKLDGEVNSSFWKYFQIKKEKK